jgi:quercetin dioxygenase-like cupin family protein
VSELNPKVVSLKGEQKYTRLLGGIPETCGMKSGHIRLRPGEEVGEHKSAGREEAIVILKGRADVFIEGKLSFTAKEGNLVYLPPETLHNVKNGGEQDLTYVYIVAPVKGAAPT